MFLRLFLAFSLAFSSLPVRAQDTAPPARAAAAYIAAAERLRGTLDRTAFDLDALAFDLAVADPAEIASALDDRLRTEVYAGALRGGAGALRSGAGNAWDQALALAAVLTEAGYETRLARARLDDAAARALIAAGTPRTPRPAAADTGAALAALASMAEAAGGPEPLDPVKPLLTTGLAPVDGLAEAGAEAGRIMATLDDAMPDGAALDARLLAEARDYVWVQARLSGLEDWRDLHIAFSPVSPPVPETFLALPLADALTHRVRIGLALETRADARLKRTALMDEQVLRLPDHGTAPLALATVARGASGFIFPVLGGDIAPGGRAFRMDGTTVKAGEVLGSIGIGGTVGGALGGALAGLGGGAQQSPAAEAVALVMTVHYDPPEGFGARESHERRLVDRIGIDARAAGDLSALPDAPPLTGAWSLQLATGATGAGTVLDEQLARVTARDTAQGNSAEAATLRALFQTLAEAGAGEGAMVYRAGPFVATTVMTGGADGGHTLGFDIFRTGLRALSRVEGDWRADPPAALRAGVAETLLEATFTGGAANFGIDTRHESAFATLSTAPALTMASGALPEAAEADRARGALLVMAPDGAAWWRVDPLTGAALGIDREGRGNAAAERIAIVDAIFTSIMGIKGAFDCAKQGGPQLCCQATNAAWTIIGFGILGKLGNVAAASEKLKKINDIKAGVVGIGVGAGLAFTGVNPLSWATCP